MASIFSLFPLVLFIIFIVKWVNNSSAKSTKLPPSPLKLPIIGNFLQLGSQPYRSLQSLSQKYGPLMLLHFGREPVLVASSPEAAREILKNNDLIFSSRPKLSIPERLLYNSKDVAFAPYGEHWRQVRSICVLQLLSNNRVQSFGHIRDEETSEMIEKIRATCSSSLINMSDAFAILTTDVLCRIALGRKYSQGEHGKKLKAVLNEFLQLLGGFCVADYIPWLALFNRLSGFDAKVERVAKKIDELMEEIIEEHMRRYINGSEDGNQDFVDILLDIQRNNSASFAFERDTLKAIVMDMLVAGIDTTAIVLEWAMTELVRYPKTMEKLQNEVRKVAQGKAEITEDDIEKMQYLKAVIKETLRLHSPAPLLAPHQSTQDIKVMGYDIPAGTQVIVNAWAIGRDPLSWNNPEDFQPERFLDTNIDFRGFNFELIPFGAGRRGCPGLNFGIAVDELALAKLINNFNFAFPQGMDEKGLDVPEAPGISIHRKFPLLLVVTPYSM